MKAQFSNEAERAVLGAVLSNGPVIAEAVSLLKPADFYRAAHKAVFAAASELFETGKVVDLVTVKNRLAEVSKLEMAGGAAYLSDLIVGMPRMTSIDGWAQIVKDKSTLRRIQATGERMAAATTVDDAVAVEILNQAIESLETATEAAVATKFQEPVEDVNEAIQALEDLKEGREIRMPTGYVDLDRLLLGGALPGDLMIVAARTSMGKTTLLMNIGENMAASGKKVAFFSAEMTRKQITTRRVCAQSRVAYGFFLNQIEPVGDEWDRVTRSANVLMRRPFVIDDSSGVTPVEIRGRSQYQKLRNGLDVVIVDYIQFVNAGLGKKQENREQEVARIVRSLKQLARDLDVVVIAAAQLSRAPEHRSDPTPRLADLRESGSIEQDADTVLFIHREAEEDEFAERTLVIVGKQRNGPRGQLELRFDGSIFRFDNAMRETQAEEVA